MVTVYQYTSVQCTVYSGHSVQCQEAGVAPVWPEPHSLTPGSGSFHNFLLRLWHCWAGDHQRLLSYCLWEGLIDQSQWLQRVSACDDQEMESDEAEVSWDSVVTSVQCWSQLQWLEQWDLLRWWQHSVTTVSYSPTPTTTAPVNTSLSSTQWSVNTFQVFLDSEL